MYVTAAILSLIGLADALYLTVEHVTGQSRSVHDHFRLLRSSEQPVRGGGRRSARCIGAAAYFTVFSLATLAAFGYRFAGTLLTLLVAAMFLVSLVVDLLAGFRDPPVLPVLLVVRSNYHGLLVTCSDGATIRISCKVFSST